MSPAWPLLPVLLDFLENGIALLLRDEDGCMGADRYIMARLSGVLSGVRGTEEWNQIKKCKKQHSNKTKQNV